MKRLFLAIFLVLATFMSSGSVSQAIITSNDKTCAMTGSCYYDPNPNSCSAQPPIVSPTNTTATTGGKIFVLGDSLTVGMRDHGGLKEKLKAKGWDAIKINAVGGKLLGWGGEQLDADKAIVASADAILIALGTNNVGSAVANNGSATVTPAGVASVKGQMQQLVDKSKAANPNIKIYWTDLYGKGTLSTQYGKFNLSTGYGALNSVLREVAAANNITILPWSTSTEAQTYVPNNDVHPNGKYPQMADFIANALGGGGVGASTEPPTVVAAGACCSVASAPNTTSTSLSGSDNAEKIYNFLVGKGLSPTQASGVMGNLAVESGYNPDAREPNGIGYGIAQWSFGRRTSIEAAARKKGVPVSDLAFQLDYLYEESNARKMRDDKNTVEWEGLKRVTTIKDAVVYWLHNFERAGIPHLDRRLKAGDDIYKRFNGGVAPPSSDPASSTSGAPCAATTSGTVDVIQKISFQEGSTMKPTAIVLHWWGGAGGIDSLIGTLRSRGLSVQVGTTVDGKVYQLTPELHSRASHAKCANSWAIGNEIEGGAKFGPDPGGSGQRVALDLHTNNTQFQSVVNVTMQLMAKYNIPLDGPLAKDGSGGVGVHSHKEVDVNCSGGSGKIDVDDVYLKRVKDEIAKRLASGNTGGGGGTNTPFTPGIANPGVVGTSTCSSNVQLPGGPGSKCDNLNGQYTPAQTKILQDLRARSHEPALSEIVNFGTTRVHKSIAGNLQRMVDDGKKAGVNLEAVVGFRSFDGQVYERTVFCGPNKNTQAKTFEEIYVKRSGDCNPSVAIPGQSAHQKGKAIDFGINGVTNQDSYRNTKEFAWLKANASKYGFAANDSKEPWHWTTDGS